jgi:hypothetical protein
MVLHLSINPLLSSSIEKSFLFDSTFETVGHCQTCRFLHIEKMIAPHEPTKESRCTQGEQSLGDKNDEISYTFSYSSQDSHELAVHCGIIIGNLSPLFRRDASTL